MRYLTVVLLALMLGTSALADGALEKHPDILNATSPAGYQSVLQGTLSAGSPTYDRAYGDEVSLDCDAPLMDSANDGEYLEYICIKSSDANPIEVVVDAAGTNISDTVLTIYCQDFDPLNPVANAIAFDDDGGEGTLSAITDDDGVVLTPGRTYWLVLSTYGAAMTGDYLIQASPNLVTCDAVPATSSSWGSLKAIYR